MATINQNIDLIRQALCRGLSAGSQCSVTKVSGIEYIHIILPFYNIGGTNLEIFVRQTGDKFTVSDFGLTLMNIESNSVNLSSPSIRNKIEKIFRTFAPESDLSSGEVRLVDSVQSMDLGLMKYIHALSMISSFWLDADTRVGLTFDDEINRLFTSVYGDEAIARDWYDTNNDPEGAYKADYRINRVRQTPIIAFGIYSDSGDRVSKAALAFTHIKDSGIEAKRVLVCRDFTSLSTTNKKRALDYSDLIVQSFSSEEFDFELAKAALISE